MAKRKNNDRINNILNDVGGYGFLDRRRLTQAGGQWVYKWSTSMFASFALIQPNHVASFPKPFTRASMKNA